MISDFSSILENYKEFNNIKSEPKFFKCTSTKSYCNLHHQFWIVLIFWYSFYMFTGKSALGGAKTKITQQIYFHSVSLYIIFYYFMYIQNTIKVTKNWIWQIFYFPKYFTEFLLLKNEIIISKYYNLLYQCIIQI